MIGVDPKECRVVSRSNRDYLSVIFRRCVFALIGPRVPEETCFHTEMLEELVMIAEQYLSSLTDHLFRLANMQRRTQPSIGDVALMLRFADLNVIELAREQELTAKIEETRPVSTLNSLYFDPSKEELSPESQKFFVNNKELVKSSRPWPQHMPAWMPPLPADHTYMHTPTYSNGICDLRQVRISLVEEGKLAEQALQRLLGDKGSRSVIELKEPKKSDQKLVIIDEMAAESSPAARDGIMVSEEPKQHIITHTKDSSTVVLASEKDPDNANASENTAAPSTKPNAPSKPKLKLQLHIKPPPSSIHPPTSSASSDPPEHSSNSGSKKLSIKLHLNKPAKKSVSILGKRPRGIDIELLAKKAHSQHNETDTSEGDRMNVDQPALTGVF